MRCSWSPTSPGAESGDSSSQRGASAAEERAGGMITRRIGAWLVAGISGSVVFWLVQVFAGGPTITAFVGDDIVSAGGYPKGLSTLAGWTVHVAMSLSYALLFGVI